MLTSATDHNKAIVHRFLDEVSDGGNLAALDALCTHDVVNHAARAGLQHGVDDFRTLLQRVHESQADRHWPQRQFIAEDDLVVVHGVRNGYWHAAEFRGVPTPQPGHVSVELAHVFRLRDGRISEHWAVRDDLGMLQQLGAL